MNIRQRLMDEHGLSYKNARILELISQGLRPVEVAESMSLNQGSVKVVLTKLRRQFGLKSRKDLITWVKGHGQKAS